MSDDWCPYCDYEPTDRVDKIRHINNNHMTNLR
jgi:uncharacterized C2H2 Zn-finger protein